MSEKWSNPSCYEVTVAETVNEYITYNSVKTWQASIKSNIHDWKLIYNDNKLK